MDTNTQANLNWSYKRSATWRIRFFFKWFIALSSFGFYCSFSCVFSFSSSLMHSMGNFWKSACVCVFECICIKFSIPYWKGIAFLHLISCATSIDSWAFGGRSGSLMRPWGLSLLNGISGGLILETLMRIVYVHQA